MGIVAIRIEIDGSRLAGRRLDALVARAAIALRSAHEHAKGAPIAPDACVIELLACRIEPDVERNTGCLVGALVGFAVELRAVAPRLGGVAQAISEGTAVSRRLTFVADLRLTASCGRDGQDDGNSTKHESGLLPCGRPRAKGAGVVIEGLTRSALGRHEESMSSWRRSVFDGRVSSEGRVSSRGRASASRWGSVVGWVAAAGSVVGLLACADALSLAPPGGGAGGEGAKTTSNAAGGAGGGQVVPCESNSNCPYPTTVCDTVLGICVGCLELDDCAHMPGTVCSQGACVCATEGESWCEPDQCVVTATDSDNCGMCGKACFGACADSVCVDAWEPISMTDAPVARGLHVAEWTDSGLFVWGGSTSTNSSSNLNTGGLYDPLTSTWTATNLVGAPSPRQGAKSVWTGTHVIVWGGRDGANYFNDGAMYDPVANAWTAMSSAATPAPRILHTVVWTGSTMIVWGGQNALGEQINSGGVYDPAADSWSATAAVPVPAATRQQHTAVWAGTEMWIYGGLGDAVIGLIVDGFFPTGAVRGGLRYDPGANVWGVLPDTLQPSSRDRHTAVYDGTQIIVFGGYNGTTENSTGHRVGATAIQWEPLGGTPPEARRDHTAVWLADAGSMIVWGGRTTLGGVIGTGAVYTASTNQWTATTPTVLLARDRHAAVSTGDRMMVWGGFNSAGGPLGDGGVFTP